MINALASVAGFAGPYAFGYLNNRTGSFSTGFTVLMVSALASGILILLTPARQRASAETLSS
jgi:nitrate/nitrite transporter NarK